MGLQIAFWVLALIAVGSSAGVILQKNLFRAALLLVVCFLASAGIFVTLSADFLAAVQVIINVGAVAILIIMSIMLTREVTRGSPSNRLGAPAFVISALIVFILVFSILTTAWPISGAEPAQPTTSVLAQILIGDPGFILIIQMSAILLLSTIIGAIVLMKEK